MIDPKLYGTALSDITGQLTNIDIQLPPTLGLTELLPFCQPEYKMGYIYLCSHMRRLRIVLMSEKKARDIAYARYLAIVHLGTNLEKNEHVDHINNNGNDDRLSNLQILPAGDNIYKHTSSVIKDKVVVLCPICRTCKIRSMSDTALHKSALYKVTCCSISCSRRFTAIKTEDIENTIIKYQYLYFIREHKCTTYTDIDGDYTEIIKIIPNSARYYDMTIPGLDYTNNWYLMTPDDRLKIIRSMTNERFSYSAISRKLNTNEESIRSFCKEYNITSHRSELQEINRKRRLANKCLQLRKAGHTYTIISNMLAIPYNTVHHYMKYESPDLCKNTKDRDNTIKRISECLELGILKPREISKYTKIPIDKLKHILRHYFKGKRPLSKIRRG